MAPRLIEEFAAGIYRVTGYGPGYIDVRREKKERIEHNIVLLPDKIIHHWSRAADAEGLIAADFEPLAQLGVELILLGTGQALKFPPPSLLDPLYRANIGIEMMDTPAACRTYNILVADGRKVAAALLLTPAST